MYKLTNKDVNYQENVNSKSNFTHCLLYMYIYKVVFLIQWLRLWNLHIAQSKPLHLYIQRLNYGIYTFSCYFIIVFDCIYLYSA